MKFTVDQPELLSALQSLQSVVEKKNTVLILGNVLCQVEDGKLSLSATDLEVGMTITIPVHSDFNGKITIPSKQFLEIIREYKAKPVTIQKKTNDWVEIIQEKSTADLVSLPADQFPQMVQFKERGYYAVKNEALIDMINKTSFAVSTDAARYNLNGVFVEQMESGLTRMTATDGHRLSYVDQEIFLKNPDLKKGIIIPRKGLQELKKVIEKSSQPVSLAFDKGYLFLNSGETYLFVKLIDGEYPDYKQVIPKSVDRSVKLDTQQFLGSLRRVILFADERSKGIKLSIKPNQMIIQATNPDLGAIVEELPAQYQGEAIDIGFNARYMLDCLPSIDSNELEFSFKDKSSPGILQGVNSKNHTYVIMPMRV